MIIAYPYLNFNGKCEEAFNFYKSIFGGEFQQISRFKDAPAETPLSKDEAEKILHVALPLDGGSMLMGSDIPEAFPKAVIGTNSYISLHTSSENEATRIFNAIVSGGQVQMPLDKTFWGSYFGMCVDKFGIQWMVSYDYEKK